MIDVSSLQIIYYTIFISIGTITLTGLLIKAYSKNKKSKQYSRKQKVKYWNKKLKNKNTPMSTKRYAKQQIRSLQKK